VPELLPELPGVDALFDGLPCGILVTSVRGTILKVNQTLCNWLGFTREELVERKKLQELFTMGGRIFHQTHWLPMLQMQGSISEVKFEVARKDGTTLPMLLSAVRRSSGAVELHEIALAISEERNKYETELLLARKRADVLLEEQRVARRSVEAAQSRLEQAVRVGALFLWDVDLETKQRRFHPEVALLLGYPLPTPIGEDAFRAAIAAEDAEREERSFRSALSEPSQVHSWSHRLNGADGIQRIVSVSGQAFLDDDGSLFQFVGVLSDVTESVRERSRAQDRALFAEQMMAIVSHDLRNPLSAIVMSAQVIGMGAELPDQKSKALGRLVNSAQRARRLIDELLDFTMARVGRGLTVTRVPIDLHGLVVRIVDELGPAFPGRGLTFTSVGAGDCEADGDRIAQLVGNLVANAMAYGAVDRPITVTSWLVGNTASITVHNEGMPIPPELLGTIFEPMVRGTPQETTARSVGLGLFIVRAIAEAHGGEVKVTSSAESGTAFEFSFPATLSAR
jgi:sigma-B regulation protein RsbU (phosphoserine phosphatase)